MSMKPSIGRKVWFYDSSTFVGMDPRQAFDATIIYVWSDECVNLKVTDHNGNDRVETSVLLREPQAGDEHGIGPCATWMPFQVGQARAQQPAVNKAAPAPQVKTIPMVAVKSSNISAVGYDPRSSTLAVKFSSGSTYHYAGVSEDQATALMQAESVGSHFSKAIRGKFPGVLVGGKAEAVERAAV